MKTVFRFVIAALLVSFAASAAWAKWLPVHSVESEKPLYVADGDTGKWYTQDLGYSVSSWQEDTKQAFSHAVGLGGGHLYEFRMVQLTATPDADSINGKWDVYRDGILVCGSCVGKAYGLSGAVGDYFKIYVGTPTAYAEKWHWSGYITHRFDY